MERGLAIIFRVCVDLFTALAYFVFAIVAASDSTDLFGDTNRKLESDLTATVGIGVGLAVAGLVLALHRVWFTPGAVRWPKAELVLVLGFPVWLGAAMLAART